MRRITWSSTADAARPWSGHLGGDETSLEITPPEIQGEPSRLPHADDNDHGDQSCGGDPAERSRANGDLESTLEGDDVSQHERRWHQAERQVSRVVQAQERQCGRERERDQGRRTRPTAGNYPTQGDQPDHPDQPELGRVL
jgi:hypothetical protein